MNKNLLPKAYSYVLLLKKLLYLSIPEGIYSTSKKTPLYEQFVKDYLKTLKDADI